MARIVLIQLLLFLLPFIGYAAWLFLNRKAQSSENWRGGPIVWLLLGGALLAVAGLIALVSFDAAPEGTQYKPAEYRDGVFIPGHYE